MGPTVKRLSSKAAAFHTRAVLLGLIGEFNRAYRDCKKAWVSHHPNIWDSIWLILFQVTERKEAKPKDGKSQFA